MIDWLGQEYGVGDKIIYANGDSGGTEFCLGEVVDIVQVSARHHIIKTKWLKRASKWRGTDKIANLSNQSKIMKWTGTLEL